MGTQNMCSGHVLKIINLSSHEYSPEISRLFPLYTLHPQLEYIYNLHCIYLLYTQGNFYREQYSRIIILDDQARQQSVDGVGVGVLDRLK